MGEHSVSQFADPAQKRQYTKLLLRDIQALERMLREGMFETGIQRIGAEQELVLLDQNWRPATNNMDILESISDPHYTTEIARFNLEINSDPIEFSGKSLSELEQQLADLIKLGDEKAGKLGTKILLTGIAPTLGKQYLNFEHMTPNERYKALNDVIYAQRGEDFELNIVGKDELITKHNNILFEACNTSFQVHLQLEPDDFVSSYNWAQLIAGPVLAVSANSPILMGKRLWHETRIALFQQSVDTRKANNVVRSVEPRVAFGNSWLKNSVTELYKDNISRFNLLFATDLGEDSVEELDQGKVPKLRALALHNGTVYKWNRACYGVTNGKPHLRIENRYIPSGPTLTDEIANSAFWLGLMVALPEKFRNLPELIEFEEVRYNFYNAARRGLDCQFNWFGKVMPATTLIRSKLLPLAKKGLEMRGIAAEDIDRYLGVIRARLDSRQNGARWQLNNFGMLLKDSTSLEASIQLTQQMYANQHSNKTVDAWENIAEMEVMRKKFNLVQEVMETDLYTVRQDDPIDLVVNVMHWHHIRHVPVENEKHELVGLINTHCIIHYLAEQSSHEDMLVQDIMLTEFPKANPHMQTREAIQLMADNRTDALPVVNDENRLLGIITESDIMQVLKLTGMLTERP
ncbi:MAG: CBS domain-containing protein [Flavobacteriales bacterium]|nr:CBS domain-containing protein [Bacteroidota bacterium]MCB9239746.1 CBS domain-containing protein [Flavobacteriales bacterium]